MDVSAHVVLAHHSEDLAWTELLPFPYTVISRAGMAPEDWPNKGREASAYLEWLIANYDNLPDYVVCLHAHRSAWHARSNIDEVLRAVKFDSDYRNLNDTRIITQPEHSWACGFVTKERAALEAILGASIDVANLRCNCCAQFYVSRHAILRHAKSVYEQLREWVRDTELSSYEAGLVLEFLWHFIFTGSIVELG
jgi:hypothetical protein